jgi:hypothetical protein
VYFYDAKIQTNIKQNLVKNTRGNHKKNLKYFFESFWNWARPGPKKTSGPKPTAA